MQILAVGSYCADLRIVRKCLNSVPSLYRSFDLPFSCPNMSASSGATRSSVSLLVGRSAEEEVELGEVGEEIDNFPGVDAVDPEVNTEELPSSSSPMPPKLNKGKGKVSGSGASDGSTYLGAAFNFTEQVGPSTLDRVSLRILCARYKFPLVSSPCAPTNLPPMLLKSIRRFIFSRQPSRMVSASP